MKSPSKEVFWEKWQNPRVHDDDEDKGYDKRHESSFIFNEILGIIPNRQSKMSYRFYIGYTNFDLCYKHLNMLNEVPGVETLDFISRYRFRVGIGTLFDIDRVKLEMERTLIVHPVLNNMKTNFEVPEELREEIKSKLGKEDFVYVLPNHKYEIRHQNDQNVEEIVECQKRVGGGIFTKWTM